jgi:hypothetical protein
MLMRQPQTLDPNAAHQAHTRTHTHTHTRTHAQRTHMRMQQVKAVDEVTRALQRNLAGVEAVMREWERSVCWSLGVLVFW